MKSIRVTSEIGPLERVLVHTPGKELLAVTPSTRADYLYDDIIDLSVARREHGLMVSVLERFADVIEIRRLLQDILEIDEARESLIADATDFVSSEELTRRLMEMPSPELADILIEGELAVVGPVARALNRSGYRLPPAPNLFFTRDLGMVVNNKIVVGSMRHEARWTEEILVKSLFNFHPELANSGIIYDGSLEKRYDYTIEGGDLHPLREDLILLGLSDRSSPAAVDLLCDRFFAGGNVTDVIIVVMPGKREAIHLDMIFTHIDHEICVVSPPHFIGNERLPILHRRKGSETVSTVSDVFSALEGVGMSLTPVLCGGTERAMQEREQWASGCNMVAVRPGLALAYARNEETLRGFAALGFELIESTKFLTGQVDIPENEKAILTFAGGELVRGGGGPRCMTMPIQRAEP